jgi:tRNA (guanine37-N1)-methyltransferase
MRINVVTLFPQMFQSLTDYGITGRAIKRGLVELQTWNPRNYTEDTHHTVDDRPYGGGPGMVMMVGPLREAIRDARASAGKGARVIYLSPQGRKLTQRGLQELANREEIVLVCGFPMCWGMKTPRNRIRLSGACWIIPITRAPKMSTGCRCQTCC